ncbi:MAG: sugar transporter [Accumulibacter sp.]
MWSFLAPVTLAFVLLAGCGNRGGLVLPPKPQAVPVAAAPVTPPSAPDAERTTADNPTRPDSSTAAAEAQR